MKKMIFEKFMSKMITSPERLKSLKGGDGYFPSWTNYAIVVNGSIVGFTSTSAQAQTYCDQWAKNHYGSCRPQPT